MGQLWAALDGAWRVLLVGMLLGAGLPAVFALGVRALAWSAGGEARSHAEGTPADAKPHPAGRVLAFVLFAIVIASVLIGIGYIVAHGMGWAITFDGLTPTFTKR